MKGMLVVRVTGLVLMASQLSSCAWLAAWKSSSEPVLPEPEPTPTPGPKPRQPGPPGPGNLPKPEPDPEPKPDPEPQPQPQPQPPPPPKESVPVARPVPGRPGFVFSPFNNKLIDVEGIPSGRLVADPHYPAAEKKYFRVP